MATGNNINVAHFYDCFEFILKKAKIVRFNSSLELNDRIQDSDNLLLDSFRRNVVFSCDLRRTDPSNDLKPQ